MGFRSLLSTWLADTTRHPVVLEQDAANTSPRCVPLRKPHHTDVSHVAGLIAMHCPLHTF